MLKRKGIDISVHQGETNLALASKDGVEFIIPRCGYAKIKDDQYENNIKKAKAAGIPIVGIYLFSYALSTSSAIEEAQFAVSQAEKMGLPKSTIIFFDLEYDTIRFGKNKGVTIDKARCMKHTVAFCDEVEKHGYKAGVYFNLDYYRNMYEPALLNRYVTWLADWTGGPDIKCDFQQFSSRGSVAGISGPVDMNYQFEFIEDDQKSALTIVDEILKGQWGNGKERRERLELAGWGYSPIQKLVNDYIEVAEEVMEGIWGNGEDRKESLEENGYEYEIVQDYVNKRMEEKEQE